MKTGDMVRLARGNLEFYDGPGKDAGFNLAGMLYEPCRLLVLAPPAPHFPMVKVLVQDGRVGWVHAYWVEVVA